MFGQNGFRDDGSHTAWLKYELSGCDPLLKENEARKNKLYRPSNNERTSTQLLKSPAKWHLLSLIALTPSAFGMNSKHSYA